MAGSQEEHDLQRAVIEVERSGEWMPAEELKETALAALEESNDMTLNLDRIDHLDASAMQILLALDTEQKNRGQHLHLVNASPLLRQWFECSGAASHLFRNPTDSNE
jgi:anti-anti-sigma factor